MVAYGCSPDGVCSEVMSAQASPRRRGPNQRPPRHRDQAEPVAVIRLPWELRRAARRAQAGLPAATVKLRCGPRLTPAAGRPLQAYRRDQLSSPYRRRRGAAAARARTREDRARRIAAGVVATHGASWFVEEGDMRLWVRRWQRGMLAFTPGRMVAAIGAEAVAALSSGTGPLKASTRPTAMSQPRPCGTRVPKTLAERTHRCPSCGLVGDRGLVAAALAAFVTFGDPLDPGTARVDYQAARLVLAQIPGLQAALAESSAAPLARHRRRCDGRARASRRRAARRSAGSALPTMPDELPTALARGDQAGASVVPAGPDQRLVYGQNSWPGAQSWAWESEPGCPRWTSNVPAAPGSGRDRWVWASGTPGAGRPWCSGNCEGLDDKSGAVATAGVGSLRGDSGEVGSSEGVW